MPHEVPETVKKDLIGQAKSFFEGAVSTVKGKDMNRLIETFTSEMTLVAEGLSEDQANLRKLQNDLSTRQTIAEESLSRQADDLRQDIIELQGRLTNLEKQAQKLAKEQNGKKAKKYTTMQYLTVIVAIAASAWVIVTLLQTIFR